MAVSAADLARQHLAEARRAYAASERLRLAKNPELAAYRLEAYSTRRDVIEPIWAEAMGDVLEIFHASLDLDSAVATARLGWRRTSAAKKLWSLIRKETPAPETPPPPQEGYQPTILDFLPPPANEVQQKLAAGTNMEAMEKGGVQKYLGLAEETSTVAGNSSLKAMGLNQTFAWAHPQNMANDLFSVRGSKVIQNMYGEHLEKLSKLIIGATDPRSPKTQSEIRKLIREEWPKLKKYQVERIARTESAAVWTTTSLNSYQANGISQFETIVAQGPSIGIDSEDPCPICIDAAADGPYAIQSDLPPWHPNCRCEAIPVLEGPDGEPWLPPEEPWAGQDMAICGSPVARARRERLLKMGAVLKAQDCLIPAPPPGESFGGDTFETKSIVPNTGDASLAMISTLIKDEITVWEQAAQATASDILDTGGLVKLMWGSDLKLKGLAQYDIALTSKGMVSVYGLATAAGGGRRLLFNLGHQASEAAMGFRVKKSGISGPLAKYLEGKGAVEKNGWLEMTTAKTQSTFKIVEPVKVPIAEVKTPVSDAPAPGKIKFQGGKYGVAGKDGQTLWFDTQIQAEMHMGSVVDMKLPSTAGTLVKNEEAVKLSHDWVQKHNHITYALRHPEGTVNGGLMAFEDASFVKKFTPRMDALVSDGQLAESTVLYRGIADGEAAFGVPLESLEGVVLKDASFLSTTADPSLARKYSSSGAGPGVILELNVPKGIGSADIEAILANDINPLFQGTAATVPEGAVSTIILERNLTITIDTVTEVDGVTWAHATVTRGGGGKAMPAARGEDLAALTPGGSKKSAGTAWMTKELQNWSSSPSGAKRKVAQDISARLRLDPRWDSDKIQKAYGYNSQAYGVGGDEGITAQLINNWARTSSDSDVRALAIQQAAKEEFGLAVEAFAAGETGMARQRLFEETMRFMDKPGVRDSLRAFVRTQYELTQEMFREAGIETLTVYRGMRMRSGEKATTVPGLSVTEVTDNPIASWSTRFGISKRFSGSNGLHGVMLRAEVPVELIVGTPLTGFGCLNEFEMVVLNGGKNTTWAWTEGAGGAGRRFHIDKEADISAAIKAVEPKLVKEPKGSGAGTSTTAVTGDDAAKVGKRIASVRHKLKNPTKYGHESWTQAEIDVMNQKIDDLEKLRADLKAGKVPEATVGPQAAAPDATGYKLELIEDTDDYSVKVNGVEQATISNQSGDWTLEIHAEDLEDVGDEVYFDTLDQAIAEAEHLFKPKVSIPSQTPVSSNQNPFAVADEDLVADPSTFFSYSPEVNGTLEKVEPIVADSIANGIKSDIGANWPGGPSIPGVPAHDGKKIIDDFFNKPGYTVSLVQDDTADHVVGLIATKKIPGPGKATASIEIQAMAEGLPGASEAMAKKVVDQAMNMSLWPENLVHGVSVTTKKLPSISEAQAYEKIGMAQQADGSYALTASQVKQLASGEVVTPVAAAPKADLVPGVDYELPYQFKGDLFYVDGEEFAHIAQIGNEWQIVLLDGSGKSGYATSEFNANKWAMDQAGITPDKYIAAPPVAPPTGYSPAPVVNTAEAAKKLKKKMSNLKFKMNHPEKFPKSGGEWQASDLMDMQSEMWDLEAELKALGVVTKSFVAERIEAVRNRAMDVRY